MSKISINKLCPCGSKKKYKKCCRIYHKGALPPTALLLMKSRYSAYAIGDCDYIINTTHPSNGDFTTDKSSWKSSILQFSTDNEFISLAITDVDEGISESYVTFNAHLSNGTLVETSYFLKLEGKWLYLDGKVH